MVASWSRMLLHLKPLNRTMFTRTHTKKKTFLLLLLLFVVVMWNTNNLFYRLYDFLPDISDKFPVNNTTTLKCPALVAAANSILNGEKISLPFDKPLWKFKQRSTPSTAQRHVTQQDLKDVSLSRNAKSFFITYADRCCSYSRRQAVTKAKEIGRIDYAAYFDSTYLSLQFKERFKSILREQRGAGYWIWKPYIILKVLVENMAENDLLLYQDAGAHFIRDAEPLLLLAQLSQQGIIVFSLSPHLMESVYTKQDAFTLMDVDEMNIKGTAQRLASFVVVRKNCDSLQFVMEWLSYVTDRRIVTDDANTLGINNSESFKDHRHDQSVLSLLSKKWGLPAYRDPSQFGNTNMHLLNGPYDQIFKHDRVKV